jgi:hypothetical protein
MSQANSASRFWERHFWKLFALAVAIFALYLGNLAVFRLGSSSKWDISLTKKRDTFQVLDWSELGNIANEQSNPARVVFKNTSGEMISVTGFLERSDGSLVVLSTVYPDEAREERVYIPIENIQYITMQRKSSKAKK